MTSLYLVYFSSSQGLVGINGLRKIVEQSENVELKQAEDNARKDAKTQSNINELADEYIEKNENYISQDEARELFIDEGYDRTKPDEKFNKKGWEVVDRVFEKKLTELKKKNEKGKVVITAGAPGSGKTTMAKKLNTSKTYKMVLDTNITDVNETIKRINKIQEAGLEAEIHFIYSDPGTITENMFKRVSKGGHLIKLEKQADSYVKNSDNIKILKKVFPELKIKVFDNTKGKGNKIRIEEVKSYKYNDIINIFKKEAERLKNERPEYERIYRTYTGGLRNTGSNETGGIRSIGREREVGTTEQGASTKSGGIEGVSKTGSDKETGIETVITAETLKNELDAAIKENKPLDLQKYTKAFLENSFHQETKKGEETTETESDKSFNNLYRQARDHNYKISKKIIDDAKNDMSLDFGGLSKLADITQPKVLKAVYDIGRYHYENLKKSLRDNTIKFGKWAKAMTDDVTNIVPDFIGAGTNNLSR
ncbi:MAG: hypothetical protein IT280_01645 [Ignavibacteria bacterium]|nr:hypothetical protein [Ignavibacteria bacterium]